MGAVHAGPTEGSQRDVDTQKPLWIKNGTDMAYCVAESPETEECGKRHLHAVLIFKSELIPTFFQETP